MKQKNTAVNSFIYRWRYPISLLAIVFLTFFFSIYRLNNIPNGISTGEIQSTTNSLSVANIPYKILNGDLSSIVAWPWHLLQMASITLFGVSSFSIRLPAAILAFFLIFTAIALFKKLFRANIAMLGGFILVSSSAFISLSRSGTAEIATLFFIFLSLLLGKSLIDTGHKKSRKKLALSFGLIISLACLAYMPAGLTLIAPLGILYVVHPHSRMSFYRKKLLFLFSSILAAILTAPILYTFFSSIWDSSNRIIALKLLGVENLMSALKNINPINILAAIFNDNSILLGNLVGPIVSLVGLLLAIIGIWRLLIAKSSIRTQFVVVIGFISLMLGIINPYMAFLLFVPLLFAQITGLTFMINSWYNMFPRNPYARVFALLPLGVILFSLTIFESQRYFQAVNYSPKIAYQYSRELEAVQNYLKSQPKNSFTLIVNSKDKLLYQHLNMRNLSVTDKKIHQINLDNKNKPNRIIITGSATAKTETPKDYQMERIVADWKNKNNVLIRVYKK